MKTGLVVNPPHIKSDDLKQIPGIGPGIEARLNAKGINTFGQLASTHPDELARLLGDIPGLSPERLVEKDWIGQARQRMHAEDPHKGAGASGEGEQAPSERQHYAVFTVELLLEADNRVRRTRVTHVQNEQEDTWAGWEPARLVDFLSRSAKLKVPSAPRTAVGLPPASERTKLAEGRSTTPPRTELGISPRLSFYTPGHEDPTFSLPSHRPFMMKIGLELPKGELPAGESARYNVLVYARSLGSGKKLKIGQSEGSLKLAEQVILNVPGTSLPPGTYRSEALVTLTLPESPARTGQRNVIGLTEGGVFQVL